MAPYMDGRLAGPRRRRDSRYDYCGLRDHEIRFPLRRVIGAEFSGAVVDEVDLPSGVRADLVSCGELFHGFEIKSSGDTLGRLGRQVLGYEQVFPLNTVVTVDWHLADVVASIPEHWGVMVMRPGPDFDEFHWLRAATPVCTDPEVVAQLLRRHELVAALTERGEQLHEESRAKLVARLVSLLSEDELRRVVAFQLKSRTRKLPPTLASLPTVIRSYHERALMRY